MEVVIDNIKYETTQLKNGKWTLPEEIKKCLRSCCGALNIDGNRVATDDKWEIKEKKHTNAHEGYQRKNKSMFTDKEPSSMNENGRYPAQTFVDSQVAEKLDLQSGVNQTQGKTYNYMGVKEYEEEGFISNIKPNSPSNYGDTGGCSKILHKCDYEKIDFDLFIYEPKVDSDERNNGLDDFNNSAITDRKGNGLGRVCNICGAKQLSPCDCENNSWVLPENMKNNHPTLKPIDLNHKILKLFKTPNEQRICYPFAGSGSEIIGGLKANFQNWSACEINADYVEIANARIKHYKENEYVQIDLFEGL